MATTFLVVRNLISSELSTKNQNSFNMYVFFGTDVFERFKDNEGGRIFKESLINDVAGMLSLYEAANHRVHAEYVLDEALNFTSTHLQSKQSQISPPLSEQVAQALKRAANMLGLTKPTSKALHFYLSRRCFT